MNGQSCGVSEAMKAYIIVSDNGDDLARVGLAVLSELANNNLMSGQHAVLNVRCLWNTDMLLAHGSKDRITILRLVRTELDIEELWSKRRLA